MAALALFLFNSVLSTAFFVLVKHFFFFQTYSLIKISQFSNCTSPFPWREAGRSKHTCRTTAVMVSFDKFT
ncbi:hypothetical protein KSP40_PGU012323 [Platanthera guangdongensis]|uniref:Secreted protein n=1 Tax=Platanthera guangdongensis TaxID=2320717 RepID=A0ABR2MK53_9ASPA